MKTQFIHERIACGLVTFVIDGNSKITAANGTFDAPRPNAFSLLAASATPDNVHCPGSTPTCRASCYVRGLAKHAPDVYAAYRENAAALDVVLREPGLAWESAAALGAWITAHAPGGFRWHVSGDVWSAEHAHWIVNVCFASRTVGHWIYTRTLEAVPELMRAPNLTVNVSADRDNYVAARAVAERHGAKLTYLARDADDWPADLPWDAVVFPDYPLRGRAFVEPTEHPWWRSLPVAKRRQVCPADQFGQSEAHRCGPCSKCMER